MTVVCNVALKRLEDKGKTVLTRKIDFYLFWGYPAFYAAGLVLFISVNFLL